MGAAATELNFAYNARRPLGRYPWDGLTCTIPSLFRAYALEPSLLPALPSEREASMAASNPAPFRRIRGSDAHTRPRLACPLGTADQACNGGFRIELGTCADELDTPRRQLGNYELRRTPIYCEWHSSHTSTGQVLQMLAFEYMTLVTRPSVQAAP